MSNNDWRSPRPMRGYSSPRFRGNKDFSPRGGWNNSPSPSSYRYQNPSPFRPSHFDTSTPIHQHHQQRGDYRSRPYFRGRGGGGNRFNSPRSNNDSNSHQEQGIDAWVSPAMWDDPWKEFTMEAGACPQNETTKFATLDDSSFTNDFMTSDNQSADLEVSDMILKSTSILEAEKTESSADLLPNYTLEEVSVSQTEEEKITPESGADDDGISAKDLLTLITS